MQLDFFLELSAVELLGWLFGFPAKQPQRPFFSQRIS